MLSATRRHPHVVNLENIASDAEASGRFGFHVKKLWMEAGGQRIACSWYEVAPGKQAFPHHFHSTFEESIYVLEGKGAARIDDERIPIAAGDYITYPPGPATAHSIINTSDTPLRYLCISTVERTDIVVYPDSNKIEITAGVEPTRDPQDQTPWIKMLIKDQPSVGYYEGESDAS